MKTIKIHFTRNKQGKIFSRLLQWYEGIPISHVAVELSTSKNLGQDFILHSVIGYGVSLLSKKRFLKDNEIMETYEIELSIENYINIRNAMLADCGEKYALMQNLGILIVDLMRRKGLPMSNPWKDGQNCSELIYRHIIPIFCKYVDLYDSDLVKPSEIRKIVQKNKLQPIFSKI